METTSFMDVYSDSCVKDFIHRAARRYSKHDPIFWQDLVAEGWIGISMADEQRTHPYYCRCAARAIEAAYRRDLRFKRREEAALERLLEKIENGKD